MLILTKFPNHIVFQSQLDNSNHTKPNNNQKKKRKNEKEEDIFNPKKGTSGASEPRDNIIVEFVYNHGVVLWRHLESPPVRED